MGGFNRILKYATLVLDKIDLDIWSRCKFKDNYIKTEKNL